MWMRGWRGEGGRGRARRQRSIGEVTCLKGEYPRVDFGREFYAEDSKVVEGGDSSVLLP